MDVTSVLNFLLQELQKPEEIVWREVRGNKSYRIHWNTLENFVNNLWLVES